MHHVIKHLWSLPLLLAGSVLAYQYWPAVLGIVALLLSLFLFLPLVIVSLIDVRRAKNLQSQPTFFEMNIPPPRPLFCGPIAGALDRIAGFGGSLDALGMLVTVIAGIGVLGYVVVSWLIHFVSHAQYLAASAAGIFGLLGFAAAFARIPAALIVLFGSAAVCGMTFLSGYGSTLLP